MNDKKSKRKRYWTVVGVYLDNNQPWMEHVFASSPVEAARQSLETFSKEESGADPVVVDVIAGKHQGKLSNESLVRLNGGVLNEIGG